MNYDGEIWKYKIDESIFSGYLICNKYFKIFIIFSSIIYVLIPHGILTEDAVTPNLVCQLCGDDNLTKDESYGTNRHGEDK